MKRKNISFLPAAVLLAVSVFLTSCNTASGSAGSDTETSGEAEVQVTEVTEAETAVPPVFDEIQNSDVHKGELILVNRDYEYNAGVNLDIVNIYANKTDSYKVDRSDMSLDKTMIEAINSMLDEFAAQTGNTSVLANSGYRNYEEQREMYEEDLENTGLEESALVAPPGHSEHHTGYAMDFAIDDGYEYPALKNEGEYSWIYNNAANYGMILRYTEQNKHITGYMAESWHFRYVGPVHASLITRMGVALEQYIAFIKDFQFDNPLEFKYSDTDFYRIYYVPLNTSSDRTSIPIPYECLNSGWDYKVSGNNFDGFIVTVKVPELSADYNDSYLYMFSSATDPVMPSDDYAISDEEPDTDDDYDNEDEENAEPAEENDEEVGW